MTVIGVIRLLYMNIRCPFMPFCIAMFACVSACDFRPIGESELRIAVERSLPLLQSSMQTWTERRACYSCHHQALGTMTVEFAHERGFAIDEEMHAYQIEWMRRILEHGHSEASAATLRNESAEILDYLEGARRVPMTPAYGLISLAAVGFPSSELTDLTTYFIEGAQSSSGAWMQSSHRPPLEDLPASSTALAVRALSAYAAPARNVAVDARIAAAREWLLQLEPANNEERVMRLLGLGWAGADEIAIDGAAQALLAMQREDGGWAQIATRVSDAYATGQALVALQQFGRLPIEDPAFQRGIRFLLNTQLDDGSWLVETRRTTPGLELFDTGFPGSIRHQFISYAGSAWATMALLAAVDPAPSRVFHGSPPARAPDPGLVARVGLEPVHVAALFGTIDELRAELDAGASPNAVGPGGVTPLMMAVRDLQKVDLLIERGAEIDATSDRGYTALGIASGTSGLEDVLARLLAAGAKVENVRARVEDGRYTALFLAAWRGNTDNVRWLLANGEPVDGASAEAAFDWAAAIGAVDVMAELRPHLDDVDTYFDGGSALYWAARYGLEDVARFLVDNGAEIDARTRGDHFVLGLTPLMAAASADAGHTRILELLLDAGADPTLENADGRTAFNWAERMGNQGAMDLLRARADP